jgi:hypothetical protein
MLSATGGIVKKNHDAIYDHWKKKTGGKIASQFHQWALK